MAENPGVHIVEIRAGTSKRQVLELRPGEPVQPMSVGRVGMWAIDAPDVIDVHAYVYFDGRVLYLQSADPSFPAKGNGQAIGMTWQQLEIPCTIEMGRARLVYRTLDEIDDDDEDKTVAQAIQIPKPPAEFRANAGTFSNRNHGPDSDATRLQPREPEMTIVSPLEAAASGPVPRARPAAGMPAWSTNDVQPNSSPTQIAAPPAPPPPQNSGYQAYGSVQVAMPAPPPAQNPMMQTLQAPMQSPLQPQQQLPQQPMTQPMPMQPMMSGYSPQMQQQMQQQMQMHHQQMLANQSGQVPMMGPNGETARVQSPQDLKGLAKARAEWQAMPPLRKFIIGTFPGVGILVYFMLFDDPPPPPPPVEHRQTSAYSASASAPPTAPPTSNTASTSTAMSTNLAYTAPTATQSVPNIVLTAPTSTVPAPSASVLPKGKHTMERDAIDFASLGQYQKAADLYDQLAQQHPEQPAYREAARLLRTRIN